MTWQNVPCCESCWINDNSTVDSEGVITSIRKPVLIVDPEDLQCHFCGYPTIIGIYVRTDKARWRPPRSKVATVEP